MGRYITDGKREWLRKRDMWCQREEIQRMGSMTATSDSWIAHSARDFSPVKQTLRTAYGAHSIHVFAYICSNNARQRSLGLRSKGKN